MTVWDLCAGPMSVLACGAAGSAMRMLFAPPESRRRRAAAIISGAVMALVIAPAVMEHWLRGDGIATQRAVALLIGLIGLIFAEATVKVAERRGESIVSASADRVLGGEGK